MQVPITACWHLYLHNIALTWGTCLAAFGLSQNVLWIPGIDNNNLRFSGSSLFILDVVRSVVYLQICIMWYAGMPFRKCWLLPVWLLSVPRNSVLGIIQIDCYMLESPTLFWDWLMGQLTALWSAALMTVLLSSWSMAGLCCLLVEAPSPYLFL